MASAWGKSFGVAFGAAWGALATTQPPVPPPVFTGGYAGDGGGPRRRIHLMPDVRRKRGRRQREHDDVLLAFKP